MIEVGKTYVISEGEHKGKKVFVSCTLKDGSVLGSVDSEFAIIGKEIVIKLKPKGKTFLTDEVKNERN